MALNKKIVLGTVLGVEQDNGITTKMEDLVMDVNEYGKFSSIDERKILRIVVGLGELP